jgi:hypothetical protein
LEQTPLVFGFTLSSSSSLQKHHVEQQQQQQQQQQRKRAREGEAKEHRGHRKRDRG